MQDLYLQCRTTVSRSATLHICKNQEKALYRLVPRVGDELPRFLELEGKETGMQVQTQAAQQMFEGINPVILLKELGSNVRKRKHKTKVQ